MTSDRPADARALASRRNGARSHGPRTAAGRARSARNALKHGLCARTVVLDDEDAAALAAFDAATRAELAPEGTFQAELVTRIVAAAWRARRADRLDAALLGRHLAHADPRAGVGGAAGAPARVEASRGWHGETDRQAALGAGLMRDGNGPRALETLVRYRGAVLAELFRSLGALKALQAEARAPAALPAVGGAALSSSARRPDRAAGDDATAGS